MSSQETYRYQFSVRWLLACMTVLSVVFGGWITYEKQLAARENAAIRKLEEIGAEIYVEQRFPAAYFLGENAQTVVGLGLRRRRGLEQPQYLSAVGSLRRVVWIDLQHTALTDEGLSQLAGLDSLRRLRIDGTQITTAGLAHLEGLEKLEMLNVSQTAIDDDAVVHLARLGNLQELHTWRTQITDAGRKRIAELCQLANY